MVGILLRESPRARVVVAGSEVLQTCLAVGVLAGVAEGGDLTAADTVGGVGWVGECAKICGTHACSECGVDDNIALVVGGVGVEFQIACVGGLKTITAPEVVFVRGVGGVVVGVVDVVFQTFFTLHPNNLLAPTCS